ncbi:MAG: hypothetical protein Hens2KO_06130 [Henriciella sp.]
MYCSKFRRDDNINVGATPETKLKLVRAMITADMRRSNAVIFFINYRCELYFQNASTAF